MVFAKVNLGGVEGAASRGQIHRKILRIKYIGKYFFFRIIFYQVKLHN